MSDEYRSLDRRRFLRNSTKLTAASILGGTSFARGSSMLDQRPKASGNASEFQIGGKPQPLLDFRSVPSRVFIEDESGSFVAANRNGSRFSSKRIEVRCSETATSLSIGVTCPSGPLSRIVLRWENSFPDDTLFLGDAWERSYGDLQWRFLQPERVMPWYFAAHREASGQSFLLGVKTQPSALCFWTVNREGVSLWMDFRNGGSPAFPGNREIPAAEVVAMHGEKGETPFVALRRFCHALSPNPRKISVPICGNNNWYYAYGMNFDANAMRRDAAFLAEISEGHPNRPYCVIDAGWNPGGDTPGGPWNQGDSKTFPDMPGLASDIKRLGVRPGIWIRPTALSTVDDPKRLRSGPITSAQKPLDLTLDENIASIHADVARMRTWGYELIKHDFSTYDLFGRWGSTMGAEITDADWHFHDRTQTNAEIILRLYRTLRDAAGDAILLGCNTMGHLGAGLFDMQRTGDDTSGRAWERTRRMGVNTLAYRLPQHGAFYTCDADCAAHTERTPWALDHQFLDLVSRSGTALFVSADPTKIGPEQKAAFRSAMHMALSGGEHGSCEPIDWIHNTTPERWRLGKNEVTYRWTEDIGSVPFRT